jgi:hypothetical protein
MCSVSGWGRGKWDVLISSEEHGAVGMISGIRVKNEGNDCAEMRKR